VGYRGRCSGVVVVGECDPAIAIAFALELASSNERLVSDVVRDHRFAGDLAPGGMVGLCGLGFSIA
jgi:hypothetical protein